MSALGHLVQRAKLTRRNPAVMEALRDVRQMRAALVEIDRMAGAGKEAYIRERAKAALANRKPSPKAWGA